MLCFDLVMDDVMLEETRRVLCRERQKIGIRSVRQVIEKLTFQAFQAITAYHFLLSVTVVAELEF